MREARGELPLTSEALYHILDQKGAEVLEISVTSDPIQAIDLGELASGSYFLLLEDQDNLLSKQKFIKK